MTVTLTSKFIRSLPVNAQISGTKSLPWFLKVIYEFWGFCMHGTTETLTPGGFPVSGVNMPGAFQTGSLLLTGSDGFTNVGEPFFRSNTVNFTSGSNIIVGKYLVAWVPGSTSNDDNIYEIQQVVDSGTIRVNTFTGATPYSSSLVPYFTSRSDIKFRIIDIASVINTTTFTSGQYLVMPLSAASLVNSGQMTPMFKVALGASVQNIVLTWSPSGSFNVSTGLFGDETAAYSKTWRNSTNTGTGHISISAADDYMIGFFDPFSTTGWSTTGLPSVFHIEVPQRLYPQGVDPNPVAGMNSGQTAFVTTDVSENYGGGWWMQTPTLPTSSFERWTTLARSPVSEYFVGSSGEMFGSTGQMGAFTSGRHNMIFFNQYSSKFYVSDVLLSFTGVPNRYSLSRVRLRRWRVTSLIPPPYQRLGSSGEWVHTYNGVVLPWDNAIVPNFFPSGG